MLALIFGVLFAVSFLGFELEMMSDDNIDDWEDTK